MTLLWPWVLPIAIGIGLLLAALGLWLPRRKRDRGLPVAHVDRMTSLAAFRGALLRYRLWIGGALIASLVGVAVAGAIGSRPSGVSANQEEDYKRDIVLCLDVSGSMDAYSLFFMRFVHGGVFRHDHYFQLFQRL